MGQHVSRNDFEWTYTQEPHASRRTQILKKYPQIKKLFGYDTSLKWVVTLLVMIQLTMLFVMKDRSWGTTLVVAYCFGGFINHSLLTSLHEIGHNLAFGHSRPLANRLLGIFANLPLGVPASVSFKKYHREHHKYQAVESKDPDLPTYIEAKLFCTTVGKLFWVMLQPFFYTVRPLIVHPMVPTLLEFINVTIQLAFDAIIVYFFGGRVLVYLIAGTLMGMGLHPLGAQFIGEHYMFKKGFETYSYYGPLNWITFNVGYHNEHHDFPTVPGSRLPEVKRIAPEFYNNLPHHTSWIAVLYDFIMDPDIGPYARIKRKAVGLST